MDDANLYHPIFALFFTRRVLELTKLLKVKHFEGYSGAEEDEKLFTNTLVANLELLELACPGNELVKRIKDGY